MAYLRLYDYYQQIQSVQLDQITGGDASIRPIAELKALEEVSSYLVQKYNMAQELTDTTVWSPAISYKAKQRFYLDAAAYVPATAYIMNNLTLQGGIVYLCTAPTTGTFDPTKWIAIGSQYSMYFVTLPNPEFNYQNIYAVGDPVFWLDKNYACVIPSNLLDHESQLQYGTIGAIPGINVFPDDQQNGVRYWGVGVAYSVTAGTLPTDTTKFTAGDNRSQKIVECLIDAAIYKIHSRVQPNNIPQLRIDNYDAAILWLKACGKGTVTANLPVIQPKQGRRIRHGGPIKNQNSY